MLKYCMRCTVRDDCNDYADRAGAKVGIWGGRRRTRTTHGNEADK